MTRVRQLVIGLVSGSALYSGFACALGLGEITLRSALNQPLNAEIELLAVGDASAAELKIGLASAEAFDRAGVDRLYFLNDLRFSPVLRGSNSVIRVVSSQPVREPYLNFIVELKRPGGQQLREYTVLLDPPTSSSYAAQTATVGNDQFTAYTPLRRTPVASRGERYAVASGESLWTIASKLRVEGNQTSLQDLMLDIHALNPDAFSNGDIHRLRAGVSLLLPDHARLPQAVASQPAADPVSAPRPEAPPAILPDSAPERPAEPQVEVAAQIRRVEEEVANRTAENLQLQQDLLTVQNQLQDLMARMEERDKQIAQLMEIIAQRPQPGETAQALPQPAPATAPAQPASEAQAAVQPAPTQAPASDGFWSLWNLLLAGLLGLLALLLLLFKRRRKDPAQSAPVVVVPLDEAAEASAAVRPADLEVPLPVRPQAVVPPPSQAALDPLEGASIYLAYGRLGEAVAALRDAAEAQPQRLDIRYRLLEVLAQQGNLAAFADEEAKLRAAGFDGERIDALKRGYPALFAGFATHVEPNQALEELELELGDLPPAQQPVQDDFQLNLDDLSLDADWDLVSPFAQEPRKPRDEPEAQQPDGELLGHDARSPFAGSMLVEEEPAEQWLELDDLPDETFAELADDPGHLNKLNLALAYIEQDDLEAACDILNEVINEGDENERQEARELLARIA